MMLSVFALLPSQPSDSNLQSEGDVEVEKEEEKQIEQYQEDTEFETEEVEKYKGCYKRRKKKFTLEAELVEEEEDEEEDEEYEYEYEYDSESECTSIQSVISFEWDNQHYEFLNLRDPGTIDDIFDKGEVGLPEDTFGTARYLHFCHHLKIPPMVKFHNALLASEIDLTSYGISQRQMQAMCAALETNYNVEKYVFKGNILSQECCNYLSILLSNKSNIVILDLTDCRIGSNGASYLAEGLRNNEGLKTLKLSKNNIMDDGMWNLSHSLKNHSFIEILILSHNKLGASAAEALGNIFYTNNSIKILDLDHNNLYDPAGMKKLFKGLIFNTSVTHLYLRWNSISDLEIAEACAQFVRKSKTIHCVDLSDNRFDGASIIPFKKGLASTQSLAILRLARNCLTSADVEYILPALKTSSLQLLDLQEIWVRKEFMKSLEKIQLTKEVQVIIGGVYSNYTIKPPDYAEILLKRAKFEAMKPKKKKAKKDFGDLMFMLGDEPMAPDQFMAQATKFKAKVSQELYSELIKQFTLPKQNVIDVVKMREKYLSIFPNSMPSKEKKAEKAVEIKTNIGEEKSEETVEKQVEKAVEDKANIGEEKSEETVEKEAEKAVEDKTNIGEEKLEETVEKKVEEEVEIKTNIGEDKLEEIVENLTENQNVIEGADKS